LYDQLELVEADLMDKDSLIKATEGCTFVAHTASPVFGGSDRDAYVKPAVDGTNYIMEACKLAGVKRIVITSSLISVMAVDPKDTPANNHWDESIWSNPDRPGGLSPYAESKTLAEKAAWDYVKALPEGEKFDVCTINPTMIIGPSGQAKLEGTNQYLIKPTLLGERKVHTQSAHGIVDVRDCALAQLKCLQVPEAAGHRFFMWQGVYSQIEVAKIISEEFGPKGWPVSSEESPDPATEPRNTLDIEPVNKILGM